MGVSVTLYTLLDGGQEIKKDVPYWENEYHEFYSANTTHNLTKMASEAGLYETIWRPYKLFNVTDEDEYKIEIHAEDLIDSLQKGYIKLKNDPNKYQKYNSPNGWGLYIHFLPFVEAYLNACKKYPKSLVNASR